MKSNYITYVLQSKADNYFYVGYTTNLNKRLDEHNSGKVKSTSNRRPFNVVYYEVCFNQTDALHREKYLKSSYGKRYIKNRLKNYLSDGNGLYSFLFDGVENLKLVLLKQTSIIKGGLHGGKGENQTIGGEL